MNYLSALPSSVPALSPLIPFFLYIFRATSPSPSCTLVWCPAPLCVLLYPRALLHLGVTPCAPVRPAASSSCAASSYSRVHNRAPSYTIVCTPAPLRSLVHLCPPVPLRQYRVPSCTLACALLRHRVPSCTRVWSPAPSSSLAHPVPSCNIVCLPATSCALLQHRVPSCTFMYPHSPSCAILLPHMTSSGDMSRTIFELMF